MARTTILVVDTHARAQLRVCVRVLPSLSPSPLPNAAATAVAILVVLFRRGNRSLVGQLKAAAAAKKAMTRAPTFLLLLFLASSYPLPLSFVAFLSPSYTHNRLGVYTHRRVRWRADRRFVFSRERSHEACRRSRARAPPALSLMRFVCAWWSSPSQPICIREGAPFF